ncbi:polysaccharide biosynthesis C-terminal domain-containing protein [Paenibacillus thalictri]|uniref:Uncharacterized protein n=1 Tax=Paenibacillus thalictri TaxID=2527873 RepID=A0A4Q9DD60_9BACL|nr:polysaccharide biosynthesis C-terminal domain-containing protein [Paenibacillus thalictri]TBL67774.1 hypothetical protein EYB31_39270 [Paenibacillus thalictri]
MLKNSFFNLSLRGSTLLSKFLLMFVLAKYLEPGQLGIYGIFVSAIAFSLYIIGMDFYIFNTREILASPKENHLNLIKDQFILHFILYLFIFPLLLFLFYFHILPLKYLIWFYLILIVEHLSSEFSRIFVTLEYPIISSIVVFLRNGAWALFVIIYIYISTIKDLEIIFYSWFIGGFVSIVISIFILRKLLLIKVVKKVDWKWLRKGCKNSLRFLISSISLASIEFVNRNVLKIAYSNELVGIYTFYSNITNLIQVFVYTAIIMIMQPQLISLFQKNELEKFYEQKKVFNKRIVLSSFLLGIFSIIGIYPILYLVNKPIYSTYISAFWILSLSTVINVISQVFYTSLYIRRVDSKIVLSSFISFLIALIMNIILTPSLGIYGVAISTLVSSIVILVLQYYFDKSSQKEY